MNVKSETDPNKTYNVQVHNGVGVCDCPGFQSHAHCKHVEQALREAGEESGETAMVAYDESRAPEPLALIPPSALLPSRDELSVMGQIAKTLVGARGLAIPTAIDSPAKAAAVMLAGWEMGLKPMTAFRHVFVVNGRTEPDAQAMMGMVRAKDPTAQFVFERYDAEAVRVTLFRRGVKMVSVEYTKADAKASGQLDKAGPWKSYTRDMLAWSAVKRCCRLGAPDLINSIPSVSLGDVGGMGVEDEAPFVEMPAVSAPEPRDPTEPPDWVKDPDPPTFKAGPDPHDPQGLMGDPGQLTDAEREEYERHG